MVAGRPDPGLEEFLADDLASSGRIDEAFLHYREACIFLPNYPSCHYNMAVILLDRHHLQDALAQYQLAGSLADSKDMALSCLIHSGQILLDLGDYETAEMRLAAALQIDPNNNTALQLRQRAVNQRSSAIR
jgi:tetratricopeptide (TPR) repeat protein